MKLVRKIIVLCAVLLTYSVQALGQPSICGEWIGTRSSKGSDLPNEQSWILTFRPDNSFRLLLAIGDAAVTAMEGVYKKTGSKIVINTPEIQPVTVDCSIEGKNLNIGFSEVTKIHGWVGGIDSFVRTKTPEEIIPQKKHKPLNEGRYILKVTIDKDNEESVLKEVFGKQYESYINKPIKAGPYHIHRLEDNNIMQLPHSEFGPPSFDGDTFKVFGGVARGVIGEFAGKVVSPSRIKGVFKSQSTSLHGIFTFDRIGPIYMPSGVDVTMPDGNHFKTGSAFEAGEDTEPISNKSIDVDLSTPERTATEIIKAAKQRDINRLWACTTAAFKRDIMKQIGGTENEAKLLLRNSMFDVGQPKLQSGEIMGKQMIDNTHCVIQIKWAVDGSPKAENEMPFNLVKEKEEWRLPKLH